MDKIDQVVDSMAEAVKNQSWAAVDRLQLVLNQLVKLQIAAIEGKKETK